MARLRRRASIGLCVLLCMPAAARAQTALPAPDLGAVAAAVEGAESSHGTNPKMWRPDAEGPQGPMQVTAAAAEDVGGGNRFDPTENRLLGRAYLAHLYRQFGSWGDAVAAYNWGPSHMDSWIRTGRPADRFPLGVARYRQRVLVTSEAPGLTASIGAPRILRRGIVHAQPHGVRLPRSPAMDAAVDRLYADVMDASAR